jgi:hypothetical protein
MSVHGHDIGYLGAHAFVYGDFAAAGFVQDGYFHPVTEATEAIGKDEVSVLDICALAYLIIGYVIGDVFYEAVVSDSNVVKSGVADTGRLYKAAGKGEVGVEIAKAYSSGETDAAAVG